MSWNYGYNRKIVLKLKSNLGLYHVVFTTPDTFPKKLTRTVVEMQQFPDIGKIHSKE